MVLGAKARGTLAGQIQGVHAIIAAALGMPFMQVSPEEAEALAEAVADITQHYGVKASGPAMLWITLAGTAGMVYIPRVYMAREHVKARKIEGQRASRPLEGVVTVGDPLPPIPPVDFQNPEVPAGATRN